MAFPLANFSDPAGLVVYANDVTGGMFWPLILAVVWIVSFGSLSGFTTVDRAFSVTSFFTATLAAFLYVLGAMDNLYVVIFMALAIIGFIMLLFSKKEGGN